MLKYFVCLMLLLSACGEPVADGARVRVRSEVRLDGVTELFARSAGDVVIESVLMHAEAARVQDGDETVDLLDGSFAGGDALVFQYAPNSQAEPEERAWPLRDCSENAELSFDFAPLSENQTENADPRLVNHTIVLKGYLNVDADVIDSRFFESQKEHSLHGLSNDGHRFGSDPDTMPTEDDKFGSDPDTMPTAKGESDKFGSDPDTMPTQGERSSDPDTMPTERDPRGQDDKFGSDPDTMPTDEKEKFGSDPDTMPTLDGFGMPMANVDANHRRVRLPFTMTFDGEFQVQKPLHALGTLDDDQDALLLDLYLNVDELFSQDQVEVLQNAVLSGQSSLNFSEPIVGDMFRLGTGLVVQSPVNETSKLSGLREAKRNR